MKNLFLFILIMTLLGCEVSKENDFLTTSMHGVQVHTRLASAIRNAEKESKEIFIVFDSPVSGCCKKETSVVFDYLNAHLEILNEHIILYLNLDESKDDFSQSNRALMITLTKQISSYYFAIIDTELNLLKKRNHEIKTVDALDAIFND